MSAHLGEVRVVFQEVDDAPGKGGLWNQNHVDDVYDPGLLSTLERLAR